jgi:membrane-associated phospholipid phosphatase
MTGGRAEQRALLVAAAVAATPLVALLLLLEAGWAPLPRADRSVTGVLTQPVLHSTGWATLLRDVEVGTRGATWWLLGTVVVGVVALRRRRAQLAAWAALAAALGSVLNPTLKALVGRARPVLAQHVTTASGPSFPSGHATSSAVGTGVLLVALLPLLQSRARRLALAAVGAVAVLAVGLDRVLIGAHWASDVVGGWSLAAAALLAAAAVVRPWPAGAPVGSSARPPGTHDHASRA